MLAGVPSEVVGTQASAAEAVMPGIGAALLAGGRADDATSADCVVGGLTSRHVVGVALVAAGLGSAHPLRVLDLVLASVLGSASATLL